MANKSRSIFNLTLKQMDKASGLLMLLPALIIIIGILIYPLLQGVVYSFKDYNLLNGMKEGWVLSNYAKLFKDELLWLSFKNTLVFTVSTVSGGMVIGLVLALILNKKIFLQKFLRGFFLIPWITCPIVAALLFSYMFNSDVGIFNYILESLHIIKDPVAWFGNAPTALYVVIFISIWMQFPFHTVMYLAALQAIPLEINEASLIDGANVIKRFIYITIPFLKNVLLINLTLMTIWNINVFDVIWSTTYGGPSHGTTTSAIYIYKTAFQNFNIGYASAIGMFWVVILSIIAYLYIKLMERNAIEV